VPIVLALLAVAAAAAASPTEQIKDGRARSNAAIAAHDFEAMRPLLADGYTILPGSSGRPIGADELGRRLASTYADPTFVTYVRTPGRIAVSRSGKRAAETGRWVGRWRKPDGEMRLSGVYQAVWVPTSRGWRLLNESFVTLACTGSRACSEVD
jgi:ketosteroid isomerase-like protein